MVTILLPFPMVFIGDRTEATLPLHDIFSRLPRLSPDAKIPLPSLRIASGNSAPLSPFATTLTSFLQLIENTTTLSPAFATLASCVKHKPFVCHSYKKEGGGGIPVSGPEFRPPLRPLGGHLAVIQIFIQLQSFEYGTRLIRYPDFTPVTT